MPKKGSTAVKVTFMTMTLVTLVTAVKFDSDTVFYLIIDRPLFGFLISHYSILNSTIFHRENGGREGRLP